MKKTILYIGHINIPEHTSIAKRIEAVSTALREFGFSIIFVDIIVDKTGVQGVLTRTDTPFCSSPVYAVHYSSLHESLFSQTLSQFLSTIANDITAIIHYNTNSWLLLKLLKESKKMNVPLFNDIAEWYFASSGNEKNLLKCIYNYFFSLIDINLNMRLLCKRTYNICISNFLAKYFQSHGCNVIRLPHLCLQRNEIIDTLPNNGYKKLVLGVTSFKKYDQKERCDFVFRAVLDLVSEGYDIVLDVFGMTEKEATEAFPGIFESYFGHPISFHGKVTSQIVLDALKYAHFSVFARDNNRRTLAGFPTKVAESFSVAVPVVTTPSSDLSDYIIDNKTGFCAKGFSYQNFYDAMKNAVKCTPEQVMAMRNYIIRNNPLDYRRWIEPLGRFISEIIDLG